ADTKPADRVAQHRRTCLACHSDQACKAPHQERLRANGDSCAACHMPSGGTEIPHLAFTHHRIGRHTAKPVDESNATPNLVASDDDSHLSEADRQRNLGLAYLLVSQNPAYARFAPEFQQRGARLLE